MVLTASRLSAFVTACSSIVALAGAPRDARAQEPPSAPAPALPPPRFLAAPERPLPPIPTQGSAWIGIGLACSNCSFESEGKAVRRWIFSAPPAVTMVDRGSPADRAGLRDGDTLIAVDGHTLVSSEGGEAFANLRPGVAARLTYRRDGRARTVSVTPAENPTSRAHTAEELQARELARMYERATREAQRELARTQGERERTQRELLRALEDVRHSRGKILDSVSTQRVREAMEQAQRALEAQRSYAPYAPSYPRVVPDVPAPPEAPVVVSVAPGYNVSPSGSLRYSRRLGDAIVTARRPGRVTVVETGDSEIVLTGGDLWVRVALSPPGPVGRVDATATAGFKAARSASGDEIAGIQGLVANPRLATALGATSGVLVLDVQPRSHADSLGIRPGDLLVSLNGSPVMSFATKRLRSPAGTRPDAQTAVVVRARERRTLAIGAPRTVTPRPR